MNNFALIIIILVLFTVSSCTKKSIDISNLNVIISDEIESPIDETIKEIILAKIEKYSEKKINYNDGDNGGTTIIVALSKQKKVYGKVVPRRIGKNLPEYKKEGYRLVLNKDSKRDTLWIIGADSRGILYGIGKLLRTYDFTKDNIIIDDKFDISSSPEYEIRGLQNIGNNPETTMLDQVLFGMNTYGMGVGGNLTKESELCAKYDIDFCLFTAAPNLSFEEASTKKVKASKAIKAFEEQIQKLTKLDAVCVPGGDTGSNTPQDIISYTKELATMVHKKFSNAEIWFSTQEFTDEGMQYTVDYLKENKPGWLTGIFYGR